jgi:hypothetical protein
MRRVQDIQPVRGFPLGCGRVDASVTHRAARIGDEKIYPAHRGRRLVDRILELAGLCNIDHVPDRPYLRAQTPDTRSQLGTTASAHGHVNSFDGEATRDRETDSSRPARDESAHPAETQLQRESSAGARDARACPALNGPELR